MARIRISGAPDLCGYGFRFLKSKIRPDRMPGIRGCIRVMPYLVEPPVNPGPRCSGQRGKLPNWASGNLYNDNQHPSKQQSDANQLLHLCWLLPLDPLGPIGLRHTYSDLPFHLFPFQPDGFLFPSAPVQNLSMYLHSHFLFLTSVSHWNPPDFIFDLVLKLLPLYPVA